MTHHISSLMGAILMLSASLAAHAVDVESVKSDRAEVIRDTRADMAKQNYEIEKARCHSFAGNAKDVCMKDAKAGYEGVLARAKADEVSAKAYAKSDAEQNALLYKAAKERCEAYSGKAHDACVGEAKLTYGQ